MSGGGYLRLLSQGFCGYTLAEVIIVMLIIAVIVSVTIGITKAKLDNVLSYTYYSAYSTLREVTTEMLSNWDPKDPDYKQALNIEKKTVKLADIINYYRSLLNQSAIASDTPICLLQDYPFEYEASVGACVAFDATAYSSDGTILGCDMSVTNGIYYFDFMRNGIKYDGACGYKKSKKCCDATIMANGDYWLDCSKYGGDASSGCKPACDLTCGYGYTLDTTNCYCRCTRYCGSGYKLDSSTCTCKKLPCTNKPSVIPCGQTWNESTCSLVGSVKTCPSGQHLNNSCECVVDCPTNLTPCQQCSNETGVVSQNPNVNRTCSDETYEWSEEQCKCIPSPRTLPRKGENFCKLFEANANIMGNTDVCQGSVISSNTTDFSNKKPDITLRNGLRIYNMHNDATAIAMLEGNTQGGEYDGVPNTNAYGYTVYIDIDGAKGDSKLWSDVYPFYITLSGKVIPGYDHVANPDGAGGDSTSHLQVSVEYEHYNGGKRNISWLAKSVPFKEGACLAGYVGDATPYCKNTPSVSKSGNCTTDSDSVCRVKQIKPVKFFF